jgi:small-conductance mechanosensitive channel
MSEVLGAIIAVAVGAVGWQVLGIIGRVLKRRGHRFVATVLLVLARALVLYGGAAAVLMLLPLAGDRVIPPVWREKIGVVLLVVVTAVVVARLVRQLLHLGLKGDRAEPLAASLVQGIVYAAVYLIAAVVILAALGVNISAMVAAIGASGLVIGLALQDTLANFFAGLYILLTGKFKVGDYVQFETFDGTVEDITWRTTILRRVTNAHLVVPNNRMSTSVLTVFRAEQSPVMVRLELLLEPRTDLAQAEAAVLSRLHEVIAERASSGFCAEPLPVIRYGDSSREGVPMIVWVAAASVQQMFEVRAIAMRACVEALRDAGIELVVLRR